METLKFDMPAFVKRASKVGAQRATIEAVTSLLQFTYQAMTSTDEGKKP